MGQEVIEDMRRCVDKRLFCAGLVNTDDPQTDLLDGRFDKVCCKYFAAKLHCNDPCCVYERKKERKFIVNTLAALQLSRSIPDKQQVANAGQHNEYRHASQV